MFTGGHLSFCSYSVKPSVVTPPPPKVTLLSLWTAPLTRYNLRTKLHSEDSDSFVNLFKNYFQIEIMNIHFNHVDNTEELYNT